MNACNGWKVWLNGTASVPKSVLCYAMDKVKLFVPVWGLLSQCFMSMMKIPNKNNLINNILNISMMLKKCIIRWFWVEVTIKAHLNYLLALCQGGPKLNLLALIINGEKTYCNWMPSQSQVPQHWSDPWSGFQLFHPDQQVWDSSDWSGAVCCRQHIPHLHWPCSYDRCRRLHSRENKHICRTLKIKFNIKIPEIGINSKVN